MLLSERLSAISKSLLGGRWSHSLTLLDSGGPCAATGDHVNRRVYTSAAQLSQPEIHPSSWR